MKNAIVLCSGGLDSVSCAHYVKKKLRYEEIILLFFDYGQRTLRQEFRYAKLCAKELSADFIKIKLPRVSIITGDLLNKKRASKISKTGLKDTSNESKKWYVPQRNLIFLSYALSLSESLFINAGSNYDIFVGFKHEGREHYPDTTKEFVSKLNEIKKESKIGEFRIIAPFINKDKEDIVLIGKRIGVDLSKTYSCYVGNKIHCGECLACRLRREGFYWANVEDPTKYKLLSFN